jgi:hypothetical protein
VPQPEIRWLCLSDLHLGGRTSLLTDVDDNGEQRAYRSAGPVAEALALCLRELLRDQSRPPRLVLLGDALELALEKPATTVMALERFLELLVCDEPVIDQDVWYVPGNHDHHVWEVAREEMYAADVAERPAGEPLPDAWHVSFMTVTGSCEALPRRGRPATPSLLRAVGKRAGDLDVHVVYPNLSVRGPGGRLVVFHHGHFTEPIYTAMTALREVVFPPTSAELREQRSQYWLLEEDNYAWIEFLWSGLGRSGAVGGAVGSSFEMLGDDLAAMELADRLAEVAAGELAGRHPAAWVRALVTAGSPVLRVLGRQVVEHLRDRERLRIGGPLSDRVRAGLDRYVGQAVRAQHLDECARLGQDPARELTFVFGHTHKPFAVTEPVRGWTRPVRLLNTGGWVVDGDPRPLTGAAVVALDERLDAVAIHVSSQSANPANHVVRVISPDRAAPTPLEKAVRARIDSSREPWRSMSGASAHEVVRRRQQLATRVAGSVAALG